MASKNSSELKEFYKKSHDERLAELKEVADLSEQEIELLKGLKPLDFATADRMIENVIGVFPLPLGIATNFLVNGKDILIPMALEEPSVVAAASNSAKLARSGGGFISKSTQPIMIGQIQLLDVPDISSAIKKISAQKKELLEFCNSLDSTLVKFGGGAKDFELREINSAIGKMLIFHLLVDVRDAMGANAVNTMCEKLSSKLEELSGGRRRLRILSNLAIYRIVHAKTVWKKEILGEETIQGVIEAYEFAVADQFRCTTHNKGIMNGIDAVVIATGNDFRAIEAGAHSFAAYNHSYTSLTKYSKNSSGDLIGEIELPMAVGTIGGATKTHPMAQLSLKILKVKSAQELAEIIACVGLAQNFAALRALAMEGIQQGHMKLHAKNVAVMAGAKGNLIDKIAQQMAEEKNVSFTRAQEILKSF
ncbi:MAG: hydroxymethylglutaryl-CoA reductase, degradative [Candidatus Diapherotrites archaeon]|nr:hydroxymethylglutaryl-CoA reductase, degradative [Candidatus Diapherotrites archaeon]